GASWPDGRTAKSRRRSRDLARSLNLGQVAPRVGALLVCEDRHRRAHAPEPQLVIEAFPPGSGVQDDLPVPFAAFEEPRYDGRPEAAALMARQHGDIGEIGYVASIGEGTAHRHQPATVAGEAAKGAVGEHNPQVVGVLVSQRG